MDTLTLLFIMLMAVIVFIFKNSSDSKKVIKQTNSIGEDVKHHMKEQQEEIKELNAIIKAKQQELENLKNAIDGLRLNNKSSVPVNVDNVMKIYDRNGVKVPLDIIEDLCYLKLESEQLVFNYIEKQRKAWKLENSKGVIKEVL